MAARWVGNRIFPRRNQVMEELVGVGNLALVEAYHKYDGKTGTLDGFLCHRVWLALCSTFGDDKYTHDARWARLRSLDDLFLEGDKLRVELLVGREPPPDRSLEARESVEHVLKTLSARQRDIAHLYLVEGKSTRAIAKETGMALGNVLYHVAKVRKTAIQRYCDMEGIPVPPKKDTTPKSPPMPKAKEPPRLADKESLPTRRRTWRQKVKIENTTFYLDCGEYDDGRLGEVFLSTSKSGSFARGIMETIAVVISTALQCGMTVERLVHTLQLLNFPPNGEVRGSPRVSHCTSLPDWVAQEINAVYCSGNPAIPPTAHTPESEVPFGHLSESWRTGA